MGAQSVGGGLACCRLAAYSLVPLHGCSERGLVLCFMPFGVLLVGNVQPSILAWCVLKGWAAAVFQVGVLYVGNIQPSTLAWVLRAWAGVVFQVI